MQHATWLKRGGSIVWLSGSELAASDWYSQPMIEKRFQCPLCGSTSYRTVTFGREGRPEVQLPLFSCMGCTAVFTDPWLFVAGDRSAYQRPPDHREKDDPREVRKNRPWKPGSR